MNRSRVVADITISLDGYVAAPGVDLHHGLGVGGEPIHGWVHEEPRSPIDEAVLAEAFAGTGAIVMGRTLFDIVDGPQGWSDVDDSDDQNRTAAPACYVVTHEEPEHVRLGSRFRFSTGGVAQAVARAQSTAGDKDVVVMGGADVIDQCLAAGLVDELRLHISPVLVGGGTRLFDGVPPTTLVQRDVIHSPRAIHVTYDVATNRVESA